MSGRSAPFGHFLSARYLSYSTIRPFLVPVVSCLQPKATWYARECSRVHAHHAALNDSLLCCDTGRLLHPLPLRKNPCQEVPQAGADQMMDCGNKQRLPTRELIYSHAITCSNVSDHGIQLGKSFIKMLQCESWIAFAFASSPTSSGTCSCRKP